MRRTLQVLALGLVLLAAAWGLRSLKSVPPEPVSPAINLAAPPKAAVSAGSPAGAAPAAGGNSLGMIRSGTYEEPPEEAPPAAFPEPAAPEAAPPRPPTADNLPSAPDPVDPTAPQQPKPPAPLGFQTKKLTPVRSNRDYGVSQERTGAQVSAEDLPRRPAESAPAPTPAPPQIPEAPVAKPARKFRAATARAPLSTPVAVKGEAADPTAVGPASDGSCPAAKPWKSPKTGNCYQTNLVCGATGGVTCMLRAGKGP